MISILLKILVFTLPLVCSNLPEFFGYGDIFRINGSYEFSKVLYFNVFSSSIILFYGIGILLKKYKLHLNKNLTIFLAIFLSINIISTIYSIFPMQSLLGGTSKGHGMLMWNNIMGLSLIFLNLKKTQINALIATFLYSLFIVVIFGIWQYYFPSFDYGNLENRAISTLGHPNYLAGLILLAVPLLKTSKYIKSYLQRSFIFYILVGCLFLTKSFLAIALFLVYSILKKIKFRRYSYLYPSLILLAGSVLAFSQFPEKLHSFVSRFYIWETSVNIILSDIPRILTGWGSETLSIHFDSFKSPELYVFENFGFSADRPHNIFLNFFYSFGIIGLGFIVSIYLFIFKNNKSSAGISLLLIAVFLVFNYASIAGYLIITILLTSLVKTPKSPCQGTGIFFILIVLSSTSSIYYSSKLYLAERSIYVTEEYAGALKQLPNYNIYQYKNNVFTNYLHTQDYYLEKLYGSNQYIQNCDKLTENFPSVENYFYCGDVLEKLYPNTPAGTSPLQEKENVAYKYYKLGIDKLPDIWNSNSPYWNNPIIKKSISGNRFYSKKYGDIGSVLKKLDITISQ